MPRNEPKKKPKTIDGRLDALENADAPDELPQIIVDWRGVDEPREPPEPGQIVIEWDDSE